MPIAAGLIHMGASPGAALAFLIAGPATNAATVTTVWKLLGGRTALLYLLTIVISAVGGGLALDWLMPAMHAGVPPMSAHVHHHIMGSDWISACWSIALLVVLAYSYAARPRPEPFTESLEREPAEPRQELELTISGMTCSHCVAAVTQSLSRVPGVRSVQADLATGRTVVAGESLDTGQLVAAVNAAGYTAEVA